MYSRHVDGQGYESGSVRGGAYIVEAGVGEAFEQRYVIGDVAEVSGLAGPSAAVLVADADVGVHEDAGENVAVDVGVGAAIAESATRLTWGVQPWLFVAVHGRLCVLV